MTWSVVGGSWSILAREHRVDSTGSAGFVLKGLGWIGRTILAFDRIEAPTLTVPSPCNLFELCAASDG